ncbi:sensor histidine kinase [Oscillospiraceae bacterium MB08-C2-2]|nr:sensor histidine kinase [Oscillospiraceae bacterium MB08-C2-2]
MSRLNRGWLLGKWLACRYRLLLAILLGSSLFVALSLLSHIDFRPALYGAGLCLFLTLLWSIYDCLRFLQKCRQLQGILQNFRITAEAMPEPRSLPEETYQSLIRELYNDRTAQLAEHEKSKSEREDYYTLWVHQIKTPIAALRLLLQSDDLHGNVFAMEQELFKIEQYAEMVLQYLRLESLTCDLLLKDYSLYELVRQSVRKYSPAFIGKRLSLSLDEFDFPVITDEKWLCFVLEQLLSNCIKYTFKGGLRIEMDKVVPRTLLISDTGIGIKTEDIPRIFERGFTGYNGRMDKSSTGIGLYLCKRVTDRLGISLTVSSALGEGTQYRLYFPPNPDALN